VIAFVVKYFFEHDIEIEGKGRHKFTQNEVQYYCRRRNTSGNLGQSLLLKREHRSAFNDCCAKNVASKWYIQLRRTSAAEDTVAMKSFPSLGVVPKAVPDKHACTSAVRAHAWLHVPSISARKLKSISPQVYIRITTGRSSSWRFRSKCPKALSISSGSGGAFGPCGTLCSSVMISLSILHIILTRVKIA
jgi:hypothetical protein